jgi:hypothetical protein
MTHTGPSPKSALIRRIAPAIADARENCAQNPGIGSIISLVLLDFLLAFFLRLDGMAWRWEQGLPMPVANPVPRPPRPAPRPVNRRQSRATRHPAHRRRTLPVRRVARIRHAAPVLATAGRAAKTPTNPRPGSSARAPPAPIRLSHAHPQRTGPAGAPIPVG